ncbi:metallophosphoesterase [Streptomyces sp. 6N223]|uniref:metallophosphoesterase n=1 Tax=Streptomyces sp. 6N223 TaxID=3457412 RepID=UPI003FD01BE4
MDPAIAIAATVATALLSAVHWYLWKRLVRDVSAPDGWYRRVGTAVLAVLPVVTVLAMMGERLGVPWPVLQVLGWPGMYWLISLLYLIPCLLLGEAVRPLALRRLRNRSARAARAGGAAGGEAEAAESSGPESLTAGASNGTGRDDAGDHPAPRTARAGAATQVDAARATATLPVAATAHDETPPAAPEPRNNGGPASPPEAPDGADEPDAAGPLQADRADPAEISRRRFVARGIVAGAGVVTTGVVGYGTYAARQLRTKHVTVRLANLPRAAEGYRIAVASDIHLGPIAGRSHCQRVVDALNATQPDVITVVGDLVDGDVADLRSAAAPLAELRAREGSFFVTGNHEYFTDTEDWVAHVRELGLVPLENERRELSFFDLAGVNDLEGEGTDHGGPDFDAALGDRDPQRTCVLMAHQPAQIYDAVDYGVDLQLSGHTHGGQVWPVNYIAALSNPTVAGLDRYDDTQLYVTRGAGAYGAPVRVGADPDITVITLASAEA